MAAAATSADHGRVAVLGARRGNCWCIGTSLDALGFRGRVTAPGPDLSDAGSASYAGLQPVIALPLAGRLVGQFGALVRRSGTLGSRGLLSH